MKSQTRSTSGRAPEKPRGRRPPAFFSRGWILLWSLAVGVLSFIAPAAGAERKNILLIIADDYGADSSELYNSTANGAALPPTPNLAALAQSGVVFSRAYAHPVCSPTRACILTGRHGFRTGVGDVVLAGSAVLSAAEFTLPEAFAAGAPEYHLAQFGKWHLANGPGTPLTVGDWTNFAGSLHGAIASYTNWMKTVNGTSFSTTNYATTDLVNDAVTWIQARGTNPWMAWLAFNAGHTPLHKPPASLAPTYAWLPGTTPHINNNPGLYFDAMIEALDTEIGRLLTAVNPTNTHVIFLGDNGSTANTLQPPYPAGRGKDTLYEGGIKVPLIIAGPAVAQPGRTNATPVHAVDLFSTLLELAGVNVTTALPATTTLDSRSFLAALQSTNQLSRRVYAELFNTTTPSANDGRALRDDRYKLIQFSTGAEAFYDLLSDPYETTNLVASLTDSQRAYYDRLRYQIYGYATNTGATIASATWANGQFSCAVTSASSYALWRCADLGTQFWSQVTNGFATTNGNTVTLTDPTPLASGAYYSVVR
jgi:arylsulfatase A-like enzyme